MNCLRFFSYLPLLVVLEVVAPCLSDCHSARAQQPTRIVVQPQETRQEYGGIGVGAIFYEAHITSLPEPKQQALFDDMFANVSTQYLQLMIRETHEPENDNDDSYTPEFKAEDFAYCRHEVEIAKAALNRNPELKLFATLYTPPAWMKTNNSASGGGKDRATLKPGMKLELAEYIWAYLEQMNQAGTPIQYLSIANEPDWPHTQPGYCLTAEQNAELFLIVGKYLDEMAARRPGTPLPILVGPNTLSAVDAADNYVPKMLDKAGKHLGAISSHDYDRRGDRWARLQRLGKGRPVWMSEWCARSKDNSPGMINSAIEYGVSLHEVLHGGANVYMAYDWAYPPRDSGEALIHIQWGQDYRLTKPYHLLKQWAAPLEPGMKVCNSFVVRQPDSRIKSTAFVDKQQQLLVVHVVNDQDQDALIEIKLRGKFSGATFAKRTRTSATDNAAPLADSTLNGGILKDELPARSMVTYRFTRGSKQLRSVETRPVLFQGPNAGPRNAFSVVAAR